MNPIKLFGSNDFSAMPSRSIYLNDLAANSPKFWSRRMQIIHHKKDNFRQTANFEERAKLTKGKTVTRPQKSAIHVQDYVKQTAFTTEDIDSTEELLTVDQAKIAPFYVDDIDEIQNVYRAATEWADDGGRKLSNELDADYQAEYSNASLSVDDADVSGGTAGNGVTASISNILRIFSIAGRKLDDNNIREDRRFANISPYIFQVITEHLAGKDSALGDSSSLGGHKGKFMNFNLFKSTNLTATATLSLATQPTTGDTVTINGIAFQLVDTIGAVAGNVLIGGSAANANTNLTALINTPGTTTANGVALSAANQQKIRRYTATAAATSTAIVAKGVGNLVLSETLSDGTDTWTPALEMQHNLFGAMNAIDVVIQKEINVKFKDVSNKLGQNIVPWELYGIKTFLEGRQGLVDVKTRTDALTSAPLVT